MNNEDLEPAARSTWWANDALFVVGNGTGPANKSNALVITKGGLTTIRVPERGGISMGGFTAD